MLIGTRKGMLSRAPAGAAGNGLLNALVAYWPGNELSGDLLDAHTNGLHLTDTNTVTSNPGLVYPTARQYTRASSEYHERASEALLQSGNVDFTFAAWVYLDSKPGSNAYVITKWVGSQEEYLLGWRTTDRFSFVIDAGGVATTILAANILGSPSLSTWYLVVAWYDSSAHTMNIQVNDGGVDSVGGVAAPVAGTAIFEIGTTGIYYFDGRIGPTAFWKSAAGGGGVLTAAQRTALYAGGAGLAYTSFTA